MNVIHEEVSMLGQTLSSILFACFLFILMPRQSLPVVAEQANPIQGPTGPYKVGVDWRHWVDNSRDETFDNAPHGRREMMVEFLYPANPVPDAKPAAYMANRKAILPAFAEVAASVGAPTIWDPAEFAQFQAHSYPKAALSDGQPQYPVLIFSHGAGGEA